jgi:hypothetical protein
MRKKISGVLRLSFALVFGVHSIVNFKNMRAVEKFPRMTSGQKSGELLVLFLVLSILIYMILNGVRELQNKVIILKSLYIIFVLTVLIAVLSIGSSGISPNMWPLAIVEIVLCAYFVVNDLIYLWIRKASR